MRASANQHVLPLSGAHRAHAQQAGRLAGPRAHGSRSRVRPGQYDADAGSRDAVRPEPSRGEGARHDGPGALRQRLALQAGEARALGLLQPRLVGKGKVNEGGQPQAVSVRPERLGKWAHGETVQDHPGALGDPLERAGEAGLRDRVAFGKSALEGVRDHPPAQRNQALDDARVVEVAAGPLVQRPRRDQMELPRGQTDPSKDAQATCDS